MLDGAREQKFPEGHEIFTRTTRLMVANRQSDAVPQSYTFNIKLLPTTTTHCHWQQNEALSGKLQEEVGR